MADKDDPQRGPQVPLASARFYFALHFAEIMDMNRSQPLE